MSENKFPEETNGIEPDSDIDPDDEPEYDDGGDVDFYSTCQRVRESLARGEEPGVDILPREHPLWILVGVILGSRDAQGNAPVKKEEVTGETIRKIEQSIQKILSSSQGKEKKSSDKGVFVSSLILATCVLLLFISTFFQSSPRYPPEYTALLEEMRTCSGPHVQKLQDGRCIFAYSVQDETLETFSWKPNSWKPE